MCELLVKLMLVAALAQFGMTVYDMEACRGKTCTGLLEKHSREILDIDWKLMSVFPEEAKRFR